MKRTLILTTCAAIVAGAGFAAPAEAQGRGNGNGNGHGNSAAAHCPPGLAKKNPPCVPPGLAKGGDRDDGYYHRDDDRYYDDDWIRYEVGDRLRDGYRWIDEPRRYGLDPEGSYIVHDGYVFSVDRGTATVLSMIGALQTLADLAN